MSDSQANKPARKTTATRDPEATRNRILDAAEQEFAKAGLLGARTEAIASKTAVTKAMLFYYFEDKETLYRAVLERTFAKRVRAMQRMDINNAKAEDALRSFVQVFLEEIADSTHMGSMFIYESIQNKGKYYREIAIATLYAPLVAILQRGVANGEFRKLDPVHTTVNIIGVCSFYFLVRENMKHLWNATADLLEPDMIQQHISEAIEFILAGVRQTNK